MRFRLRHPRSATATAGDAPVADPQGGEMWDETWTARCADGDVRLTITRRYEPMY